MGSRRQETGRRAQRWIALLLMGLVAVAAAAQNTLLGERGGPHLGLALDPATPERLFRGDLEPDLGLGCSNPAGTSGGPNEWAVGVTGALAPPFDVVSVTYNVFTQVSPTLTALSFVAWRDSADAPGAELGRRPGLDPGPGNHTAVLAPPVAVPESPFFFGLHQAQVDAGMRLGQGSAPSGAGHSFLRAPACGAATFFTVTAVGFPGDWVLAAVISDSIPVELLAFDVD